MHFGVARQVLWQELSDLKGGDECNGAWGRAGRGRAGTLGAYHLLRYWAACPQKSEEMVCKTGWAADTSGPPVSLDGMGRHV